MNFSFKKTGPIGFDLAWEKLNLVQVNINNTGPTLRDCVSLPFPESRATLIKNSPLFKQFAREALKKGAFKGRKIVTCLPASDVRVVPINYECRDEQNEAAIIIKGTIDKIGGDSKDYVFDYIPIRSKEKNSHNKNALVVAARRDIITSYLELLNSAGLEVAAIDMGPAVLRRLTASLDKDSTFPSVLLINFGRLQTYVTFIAGRRLMLDREFSYGENIFAGSLAQSLEVTETQALEMLNRYGLISSDERNAKNGDESKDHETRNTLTEVLKPVLLDFSEEINRLLVYAASETRGGSVEKVYILGGAARFPGLDQVLQEMLSIPTKVLNPLAHLVSNNTKPGLRANQKSSTGMAIAVGLALREI